MSRIPKSVAGIATAIGLVMAASQASAAVIQLGFILDESGSIGSSNYTIIKQGLANAINTIVPTDSTYEVSVVAFGSGAQTVVNHVVIDSVATRTAVANAILADTYSSGSTNMAAAFSQMQSVFGGSSQTVSLSYVNLATDGQPDSDAGAIAARNNLIAAGTDNISIEGIGNGIDANFLQTQLCYPGPCDASAPFNFPTQGFYIGVANAQGYADAIGNKVRIVTNQDVPEPATLALLGAGLLGLGIVRRRRG